MKCLKIDSEDFEDLLYQVEISFHIEFGFEEIHNNLSIKEIIDMVVKKMNLQKGNECSSEIAFFWLKLIISKKHNVEPSCISLETKLKEIFPFKGRRKSWSDTFNGLGLSVPKLGPFVEIFLPAIQTALISFFFIFGTNWTYGLPVFLISATISYLSYKYGKELPCKDLRELVNYIVKNDYYEIRTKIGTYNRKEMNVAILNIFSDWLNDYERKYINLETKIDYMGNFNLVQ